MTAAKEDSSASQLSSPSTPLVQSSSLEDQRNQLGAAVEPNARTSTPLLRPESFTSPNDFTVNQSKQVTFSASTSMPTGTLRPGVTFYDNSDSDDQGQEEKNQSKMKKLKQNRSKQKSQPAYSSSYSGDGLKNRGSKTTRSTIDAYESDDQNDDKVPLLTSFKDKIKKSILKEKPATSVIKVTTWPN